MSFLEELKRRNVFRVVIAYSVVGWLIMQVTDTFAPALLLPEWFPTAVAFLLIIGFPLAVFFAWAFEITPEGLKREAEVDRSQSVTHITRRKLDRVITFLLVLAVAYFAGDKFLLSPAPHVTTVAETSEEIIDSRPASNTIAVLPFVNMSDDVANEYFSDGLSEELLNVLAKNPALQVAARTSSFSLKGEKLEIGEIGRRLNVDHVLEGSVRKSGDRVRITAQLIRVSNGFHLWSETYDRDLNDIFAVQDEITARITAALIPKIVGEPGWQASAPASSGYEMPAEAYRDYLLARDHFNRATSAGLESAYELLKALVREHPEYAEAQALYAHVTLWNSARMGGEIPWIIAENQIRRALQKASSLKPALAEIYLVEGRLHKRSGDPETAIEFFERAIELNPSYAEAYRYLSQAAEDLGRTSQAWEALEMARKLDPISVSTLRWVIRQAREHDRPEMADDAMQVLRQVAPARADDLEYRLLYGDYRFAEAAIALEDIRANWPNEDAHEFGLANLYAVLGKSDEAMALNLTTKAWLAADLGQREIALSAMEEEAAKRTDPHDRADLYWVTYVILGMHDEALEVLSDLWYGYAAEDIGPKMDWGDAFVFVELLREAGRADEAAPIAEQLIEIFSANEEDHVLRIRMLEGDYEEALRLLIEDAKNGKPLIGYTSIRVNYFALKRLPEFATFDSLIQGFRKEQRALYDQLKSARASAEDKSHP